jgi:hypothetical protein
VPRSTGCRWSFSAYSSLTASLASLSSLSPQNKKIARQKERERDTKSAEGDTESFRLATTPSRPNSLTMWIKSAGAASMLSDSAIGRAPSLGLLRISVSAFRPAVRVSPIRRLPFSRLSRGSVYLPPCREALHILLRPRRPKATPREPMSSFSLYSKAVANEATTTVFSPPPTRAWGDRRSRSH